MKTSFIICKGQVIRVDNADFDKVSAHRWNVNLSRTKKTYYATARFGGRSWLMHRFIMNLHGRTPDVDHKNGNGLDNRRSNLRLATRQQNIFNAGMFSTNTTGSKGVSWNKKDKRFSAQIVVHKKIFLGNFKTIKEASAAYKKAAKKLHGDFYRKIPERN